ncbi:MAG: hypothetical protein DRG82_01760 [Deltaproteobacteria bacterium]|nr:MAG: hypothetical protein DRG82_01760 [Deltaproteobacteria bacterium]
MKTGVIVYVSGASANEAEFDVIEAAGKLQIDADRVETVVGSSTSFDVMDAWWKLTAKGMKKVVCQFAEVTDNHQLRLTGRELRLCG